MLKQMAQNVIYFYRLLMQNSLTLFRMGIFGAAHGLGGRQKDPLPKIFHTYPKMTKLGTVIP